MQKSEYKGYYNMVSNASKKEATIYIYGVIGGFNFDTWEPINTADKFVEDFAAIEKDVDTIHVKINSPGGNILDGLPIYNTLKNSTKEVKTYVDGVAYSMAALIALSGDKVYGYANSMLMFHNGSTFARGNAKELREQAETLDAYDEALGSIIEEKLNITEEAVKEKYLNFSDNYFVGKKAKKIGFFDEILTSKKVDLPNNIKEMSPTDLMEHYSKMNFKEFTPPTPQKPKNQNNMSKSYLKLEAISGSKFEDSTEDGVFLNGTIADAVEAKLTELEGKIETANTAVTDANTKTVTAETNLTTVNDANTTAIDAVNASLELEGDAKVTDVAGAVAALQNKITVLGEQPGATHTKLNADGTPTVENAQMDFNTPFYKSIKKHLN